MPGMGQPGSGQPPPGSVQPNVGEKSNLNHAMANFLDLDDSSKNFTRVFTYITTELSSMSPFCWKSLRRSLF